MPRQTPQAQYTYAFCPKHHIHRLLIDVPKDVPVLSDFVWPPECLDRAIASQKKTMVSQLRPIRVADCPIPLDPTYVRQHGLGTSTPMIPVKINDIVFLAHLATGSIADYMNETLYNLIKSSKMQQFVFRETNENLRKYFGAFNDPLDITRNAVLPFEITTSKQRRVLYHPINIVKGDTTVQCVLGKPFLDRIAMYSFVSDRIQIGKPEWDEFVYFWKHDYNGHHPWIISVYKEL